MSAYPTYVPDFRLAINGSDMPAALKAHVTSVRYQDGLNAADRVEVGFANTNLRWLQEHIRGLGFSPLPTGVTLGPIGRFDVTAGGAFDFDNKVELGMGYAPNPLEPMFLGSVTGVDVTFPNGGMPTMTLVAHDYLNRLAPGKYARGFGPLADALVVMILSAENLLIPMIDPTITTISAALTAINVIFKGTGTKQEGESDLDLLTRIAKEYDAEFWVDGNTLYLSRFMKEYSPSVTLTWGSSLLDFSPRVTTIGQVAGVSMKFTLREIPLDFLVTPFEVVATRPAFPRPRGIYWDLLKAARIEAISSLRWRFGAELPAILITADRSPLVREEARQRDIQVLNKPLKPAALRALIAQWRVQRMAAAE